MSTLGIYCADCGTECERLPDHETELRAAQIWNCSIYPNAWFVYQNEASDLTVLLLHLGPHAVAQNNFVCLSISNILETTYTTQFLYKFISDILVGLETEIIYLFVNLSEMLESRHIARTLRGHDVSEASYSIGGTIKLSNLRLASQSSTCKFLLSTERYFRCFKALRFIQKIMIIFTCSFKQLSRLRSDFHVIMTCAKYYIFFSCMRQQFDNIVQVCYYVILIEKKFIYIALNRPQKSIKFDKPLIQICDRVTGYLSSCDSYLFIRFFNLLGDPRAGVKRSSYGNYRARQCLISIEPKLEAADRAIFRFIPNQRFHCWRIAKHGRPRSHREGRQKADHQQQEEGEAPVHAPISRASRSQAQLFCAAHALPYAAE